MIPFALTFAAVFSLGAGLISLLTVMPQLGKLGKTISESFTQAPGLDLILSVIVWIPWLISGLLVGWVGVLAALVGQILALQLWIVAHELVHSEAVQGPRIVSYLNQRFGWWRNHLALWVTAVVLPVFFLIRLAQIVLYPFLIWLLGFPTYKHSEWVNVSRQKFEGLVGHDLIWCLYCDWMTGVYSLGAEMLRNVESFWCPIRFYNDKKCENCRLDFPDIDGGWVAKDSTMADVVQTIEDNMPSDRQWTWFGHPDRGNRE
ncbi:MULTISPECIES: hypothetical protein [Moorena]|uniref:Uncharacterized protein n=1 Tax=Moorena producens 3L TaxID=489825 RepID=F4XWG3_9CYAN|nr:MULTISPECIES: hypothetical protein [Moorena]EGJ31148.1 hypothetical protein LYNGBM3L_43360 [Moorena producens 3L]NEP35492.1 hypothetical protein [Moorena sp. SIO3B2]NEP67684.1 hypothetical protein [Moorena sp. SIO3A5]OLT66172.1 hypothetical protein BI334_15095 [Moorena producens 3L]